MPAGETMRPADDPQSADLHQAGDRRQAPRRISRPLYGGEDHAIVGDQPGRRRDRRPGAPRSSDDLPLPEAPRMRTPRSPTRTALA